MFTVGSRIVGIAAEITGAVEAGAAALIGTVVDAACVVFTCWPAALLTEVVFALVAFAVKFVALLDTAMFVCRLCDLRLRYSW
jgi:nicotinamide riboside transporter PnuC